MSRTMAFARRYTTTAPADAVYTHQTRGGQFIDVGVVDVIER